MCTKLIERYPDCKCVYRIYIVKKCHQYGRNIRSHVITEEEAYLPTSCGPHSHTVVCPPHALFPGNPSVLAMSCSGPERQFDSRSMTFPDHRHSLLKLGLDSEIGLGLELGTRQENDWGNRIWRHSLKRPFVLIPR